VPKDIEPAENMFTDMSSNGLCATKFEKKKKKHRK